MAEHFIRETRYYKNGRIRITYWCGKKQMVEPNEEFDVKKATSRRGKADCSKCGKASGLR